MNIYPVFVDVIKYTLSGLGIVWVAFYLIKPYLDRIGRVQAIQAQAADREQTLPLKLQAYERLILYIDRMNPANMLVRLGAASFSAAELHAAIINELRTEFQHNVTQQLYVSSRAWGVIKRVKDDTTGAVNAAVRSLPADATGLDLAKAILGQLSQVDEDPYEIAIALVKKDVEHLI